MKKFARFTFALAILSTVIVPNTINAAKAVYGTVVVNGEVLESNTEPIILNGNTMVPFREIFEALEMSVKWDNTTKTVIASKEGITIKMTADDLGARVNNAQYKLTQTPFITPEGLLYVNLRFIGEAVGAEVSWDNSNKLATVTSE
ncbi:hypothetical protein PghCCS26_41360 [Paenibacillus glycanilyticus]|uniref:Copper amine oxidase-like N-terminal domain-containing protein n=1 Tax=Paenibacillus glycanilyticus TaxID=126569 RepID=A0ABQ6NPH4_9BACL|nr:copper amine oxidase N-terminal domain-containing protein [Paenibacillus glycanilyticus]GMK47007.1 hypothetical protein PghCCS26_41360 [Paenibacillus glycanilyticus]